MNKNGFMKTVEVFIAVMITFTFLLVFLPSNVSVVEDQSLFRLQNLERNDKFRNCVLQRDYSCINTTIDVIFESRYNYDYLIYTRTESEKTFNETTIRTYSWFYAGNQTSYDPTVFKLYYWDRN